MQQYFIDYDKIQNQVNQITSLIQKNQQDNILQQYAHLFVDLCKLAIEQFHSTEIHNLASYIKQRSDEFYLLAPQILLVNSISEHCLRIVNNILLHKQQTIDLFEQCPKDIRPVYITYDSFTKQKNNLIFKLNEVVLQENKVDERVVERSLQFLRPKTTSTSQTPMNVFCVGVSKFFISLLERSNSHFILPECYPFNHGQKQKSLFQNHRLTNYELIADTSAPIFIQNCSCLLFEPIVIHTNGQCLVDSNTQTFIYLANFYKIPVYGLFRTYQFSNKTIKANLTNPELLEADFDQFGEADVFVVQNLVVEPEQVELYVCEKGIYAPEVVFRVME
ncbi:Conserved_hypothetical protein [Hexamita inflata]|uniref:Uncharacterized protein n=1 Tax=Hexamita inflata TaxID=28002 RepID=A0AA86P9U6_9EUKA|nr:Conserved hypothetical protein [Hexamita inflata]